MTFNLCRYLPIFLLMIFLTCSQNPVDINYQKTPLQKKTYDINNLETMISDPYWGFWALSYTGLYRIIPPDSNNIANPEGIVFFNSAYNGKYGWPGNGEFFYYSIETIDTAFHFARMITQDGIFTLYDTNNFGQVVDFDNSPQWEGLFSIDFNGACWYVTGKSKTFSIIKKDNTGERTFSDSINVQYPEKMSVHFAGAGRFSALSYTDDSLNTYLRIYDYDRFNPLLREEKLFHGEDSVKVLKLFWFNDRICAFFHSNNNDSKSWYYKYDFSIYGHRIIHRSASDTNWLCATIPSTKHKSNLTDIFNPGYYLKTRYRSENQVWLYNNNGYFQITRSPKFECVLFAKWTDFRTCSSVNRFNLHCFKKDTIIYYDEATQDFIYVK